jgi:hypothetical protein
MTRDPVIMSLAVALAIAVAVVSALAIDVARLSGDLFESRQANAVCARLAWHTQGQLDRDNYYLQTVAKMEEDAKRGGQGAHK